MNNEQVTEHKSKAEAIKYLKAKGYEYTERNDFGDCAWLYSNENYAMLSYNNKNTVTIVEAKKH
jgi:hypothetical protein